MKKFCTAVFLLLFFFSLAVTAAAAPNTYELSELGLRVTIPEDYWVITRETLAGDPVFEQFGFEHTDITREFKAQNIYLSALPSDVSEEIVITMVENSIKDLNLIHDALLEKIISNVVEQYKDYGIHVLNYEICQHSQAKFVKLYFRDSINYVYGLQYYTIYNNKAMNFTMRSYSGPITSAQENTIKAVVDSIRYNTLPQISAPGEDAPSFRYSDADSGTTYIVPDNWKQKELSQNRKYIDVKFVSTKDAGGIILYGSTDLWAELPPAEQMDCSRADLDHSLFTKEAVAEIYDISPDSVAYVLYNGIEYY